ncbi:hypothetical protein CYY_003765 [Polysphondylium violaceum]|uniref:Uncharacterized protein n=1 Tax=Polysphondylium violaceum TaxID=133409 RepID=A0A8J4PWB5_9MYCE|nr:hypothetical protein CYY_003765 [Polysphondylium violaceum]
MNSSNNNNNNNNKNNRFSKILLLTQLFKQRKWILSIILFTVFSFIMNRRAIIKRVYKLSFLPNALKLFIEQNLLSFQDYDSSSSPRCSSLVTPGATNSPLSFSPPLLGEQKNNASLFISKEDLLNNNNNNNSNNNNNDIIVVPRVPLNQLFKKKICISTIGTIFEKKINYDQITDKKVSEFIFKESEKDILVKLAKEADLYLITMVENEQEEKQVDQLLSEFGIYNSGLNKNKSLFCSTSQGKGHISRHLEVILHIDDDISVLQMLKPFVKYLVLIGSITTTTSTTSSSTTTTPTTTRNSESDKQRISSTLSISNYFYYSA